MIDKELEAQFKKEKHMNLQLKEKLKECEMEKLRIIEQLSLMEAKHDVVVIKKGDNHIDLDKAQMNVNELINYRQKVLKDLDLVERELRQMHEQEDRNQADIYELERRVNQLRYKRNQSAEEKNMIQQQVDSSSTDMIREKQDLEYELNRNRLMLAGHVLSKSISRGLTRITQSYFSDFSLELKQNDNQIQSVLAFRELLFNYETRRNRKYFDKWVRNKL